MARTRNKISPRSYTDCWHWPKSKTTAGYGDVRYEGKHVLVHRLFYEKFIGAIPKGLTIDHLCRQKDCFNPKHMEVVTLKENGLRAHQKKCILGHILIKENLYMNRCRECRKISDARWRAKRDGHNFSTKIEEVTTGSGL
jgi:hypothetical protein